MSQPRFAQESNTLPNGDVFVSGGVQLVSGDYIATDSAEIFSQPTAAPMRVGGRLQP